MKGCYSLSDGSGLGICSLIPPLGVEFPTPVYFYGSRIEAFEMPKELFIKKIASFFAEFRDAEIEEDGTDDWPELIAFKNAVWPDLSHLAKEHTAILSDLIIYHQYDILHIIIERLAPSHNVISKPCTSKDSRTNFKKNEYLRIW